MSVRSIIIALDGPAASGKSTTARHLAKALGYVYVDTGAMYRAVTLALLQNDIDISTISDSDLQEFLKLHPIHLKLINGIQHVFIGDQDVSEEIRSQQVTDLVSKVSSVAIIREKMVELQQEMGKAKGLVMDGRDIGTVVFPEAELKVFMIADVESRAMRRYTELKSKGVDVYLEKLKEEIIARDLADSSRETSPLKKADDAITLDTSHLTIEEQVSWIVEKATSIINRN